MNKSNVNMMSGVIAVVLFVLSMVVLGTADAGDKLGTAGTGQTHAHDVPNNTQNHWNNPNDGGSIGGCSDDGKWCWNIQIGNSNHYPTFPIEVYGNRARNLIAEGRIEYANMNYRGVMFLGVFSRYHNRYFECEVNVPRRQYHCVTAQ